MTYQDLLNEAKDKIDRLDAELILGFVENKRREKIFSIRSFKFLCVASYEGQISSRKKWLSKY